MTRTRCLEGMLTQKLQRESMETVQKEVRTCPRYLRMSLQLFHIYSGEDSVPQGPGMVQTKPAVN